jgi:hypothetical protein
LGFMNVNPSVYLKFFSRARHPSCPFESNSEGRSSSCLSKNDTPTRSGLRHLAGTGAGDADFVVIAHADAHPEDYFLETQGL